MKQGDDMEQPKNAEDPKTRPLSDKEIRQLKRQINQRRRQAAKDAKVSVKTLKIEFNC